jgi:hypothetical protein
VRGCCCCRTMPPLSPTSRALPAPPCPPRTWLCARLLVSWHLRCVERKRQVPCATYLAATSARVVRGCHALVIISRAHEVRDRCHHPADARVPQQLPHSKPPARRSFQRRFRHHRTRCALSRRCARFPGDAWLRRSGAARASARERYAAHWRHGMGRRWVPAHSQHRRRLLRRSPRSGSRRVCLPEPGGSAQLTCA